MRSNSIYIPASSLLLLLLSLPSPGALCQPATGVPSETQANRPSGSASTGSGSAQPTATYEASSGPPRTGNGRGESMENINKLEPGKASSDEKEMVDKLSPKLNPRKTIVDFTSKFSRHPGPPFLQSGQLLFLAEPALRRSFPGLLFYVLRFRQYPIGFDIPAPMKYNNIFTLDKKGNLKLVTEEGQLKSLFNEALDKCSTTEARESAAACWLTLEQELLQDGMYQFAQPRITSQTSATGFTVRAVGPVNPATGNVGEVKSVLHFNSAGAFISAETGSTLQAGMRPICQSTKLLDPDPIVRKMAERDLLIMGKFAKPYLNEQHERVSRELQNAIDEVWKKIEAEDRYP